MSDENAIKTISDVVDIEKQDVISDEPLEKIKEKPPPGINASLVVLYALFCSMFIIGLIKLNSCPINILIPIYLIVGGSVGASAKFLSKYENKYIFYIVTLLILFNCIWHALGTYWVFKEYQPNYEKGTGNNEKYCDRTVYLLAFWIFIIEYISLGFIVLLSGCYLMMKGDFKKK